ncbi:hypothetical protein WMF44_10025 [Sorangium sp. So ce426]
MRRRAEGFAARAGGAAAAPVRAGCADRRDETRCGGGCWIVGGATVACAGRLPQKRFVLGGSLYPEDLPWAQNVYYVRHVAPPDHPAFYCSSPLTLNVTRGAMAAMGYCPSGRLFEAAA